jgi:hypothetical protein
MPPNAQGETSVLMSLQHREGGLLQAELRRTVEVKSLGRIKLGTAYSEPVIPKETWSYNACEIRTRMLQLGMARFPFCERTQNLTSLILRLEIEFKRAQLQALDLLQ